MIKTNLSINDKRMNKDCIQDYKQLYIQQLKKVNKLASIQRLVGDATNNILSQQTKNIIQKYEQEVKDINKRIEKFQKQNQNLRKQIKKLLIQLEQKESLYMKKSAIQFRKKQMLGEQIELLKQQIMIMKKQSINNNNSKHNKPTSTSRQSASILQESLNKSQDCTNNQIQKHSNLLRFISEQNIQIKQLLQRISSLQGNVQQYKCQIEGLKKGMKQMEQLSRLQISSKQCIIKSCRDELLLRQRQLLAVRQSSGMQSQARQELRNAIEQNENLHHEKDLYKCRWHQQIQLNKKYLCMLQKWNRKEQELYKELQGKDIEMEEMKEREGQLMEQVQWLKEVVDEIKGKYIHTQLQKQNLYLKQQQHHNSKHNSSRFTNPSSNLSQNQTSTNNINIHQSSPISSLNASSLNLSYSPIQESNTTAYHNANNYNYTNTHNINNTDKIQSHNLNHIKKSFYQHKHLLKTSKPSVKPFQI